MCGICGSLGPVPVETVERMNAALQHRGPDEGGLWTGDGVTLAMRRLSIIDVVGGRQPVVSSDGSTVLVFNGEIYNFRELRKLLKADGCQFASQSDSEVLLHWFLREGLDGLSALKGMFAFAFWDQRDRALYLIRDRFGMKPLYYWKKGERFLFASEIRGLLASGLPSREINLQSVARWLQFPAIPGPETIFQEIQEVPAATWMRVNAEGQTQMESYWTLHFRPDRSRSRRNTAAELRSLLQKSVQEHMVSDVPLGAFLSGGIDSNTLVALASEHQAGPLATFSVRYDPGENALKEYDEGAFAQEAAARYGIEHHEHLLTARKMVATLPEIIRAMDQPTGDGLNTFFISKLARTGVTVALSGTGSDELFAGYPWFGRLKQLGEWAAKLQRLPPFLRALAEKSFSGNSTAGKLFQGPNFDRLYRQIRSVFSLEEIPELLIPLPQEDEQYSHLEEICSFEGSSDAIDYATFRMLNRELPHLLLRDTDAMSMAHSLEVRLPFLDHELVEFAATIPPEWKWEKGAGKAILKEAVRGLIPESVLLRPKRGFILPLDVWLRGPLREIAEDALSPDSLQRRGFFRPEMVRRVRDEFLRSTKPFQYQRYWNLIVLELWLREHGE